MNFLFKRLQKVWNNFYHSCLQEETEYKPIIWRDRVGHSHKTTLFSDDEDDRFYYFRAYPGTHESIHRVFKDTLEVDTSKDAINEGFRTYAKRIYLMKGDTWD